MTEPRTAEYVPPMQDIKERDAQTALDHRAPGTKYDHGREQTSTYHYRIAAGDRHVLLIREAEASRIDVERLARAVKIVVANPERFGLKFYEVRALPEYILSDALIEAYGGEP
jgi:hypothetical protein